MSKCIIIDTFHVTGAKPKSMPNSRMLACRGDHVRATRHAVACATFTVECESMPDALGAAMRHPAVRSIAAPQHGEPGIGG